MRTASLHAKVIRDLNAVRLAVGAALPVKLPLRYEGRNCNLSSFIRMLNLRTEPLGIYHERSDDVSMPQRMTVVSGLWLPASELPENGSMADVRLLWHVHPTTKRVGMTPTQWDRRRFYFWERIAHECVHRHQGGQRLRTEYEPRTFAVQATDRSRKLDQEYYGNYDELEAYAHDAALELVTWFPDMTFNRATALCDSVPKNYPVGPTWSDYIGAFEPGHPAIRAFHAKTRSWWLIMRAQSEFYASLALPKLLCSTSFNV